MKLISPPRIPVSKPANNRSEESAFPGAMKNAYTNTLVSNSLYMQRRVVVTGMGAVSPNGIGREAFWKATAGGVSGTGPITLFDASKLSCRVAAEVKDFDFDRYISKKDKDRVQRAVPMAFSATDEAAEDAGLNLEALTESERENIGVIIGTGAG